MWVFELVAAVIELFVILIEAVSAAVDTCIAIFSPLKRAVQRARRRSSSHI